MPLTGAPRSFETKFNFTVEIDGIAHAGFQKAGPFGLTIESIKYREGGRLVPHNLPGLVEIKEVTLERGAVHDDSDLWDWVRQVADSISNQGQPEDSFRRDLDVIVRDRNRKPIEKITMIRCWPSDYERGDFDNEANELSMEKLVLQCEGIKRSQI